MEEQKKNEALVEVKNNSIQEMKSRILPKVIDGAKRIGKIGGYTGIAMVSLVPITLGSAPVAALGAIVGIKSGYDAILNTIYKTEPGLMFVSQKRPFSNEIRIFQASLLDAASKMRGYTNGEKGGMMGLQTLVGFSRYKRNLEGSDYEIGENGQKIYSQKISTVTHGINIKNFEMFETLGYIKIDNMDGKGRQGTVGKILGRQPKDRQSLLIIEKLGFQNFEDIGVIAKAALTGDKETIEKMRKPMKKVTFRLTDKPINFEELYDKFSELDKVQDKNERVALRRMAGIFNHKRGILTTKKLDIVQDKFGRPILKYNTKESFGERMQKRLGIEQKQPEGLKDIIREEVDISQAIQKVQGQGEKQVTVTKKIETR